MTPLTKTFIVLGSFNAALVVILGAFGAHILKAKLSPDMITIYQTGVQYHFYHTLGLFAVAFVASQFPASTSVKWSGWTMIAGIVLFSGSLYILSISGIRWLGAITPIGGTAFILSWVLLMISALKG